MITLLFKNWKLVLIGLLLVALSIAGLRIKSLKLDLKIAEDNLAVCQDANIKMQKTIAVVRDERDKIYKNCNKRLEAKENLLNVFRKIDQMKGGNNEKINSSGNPVVDALNSMWNNQADQRD